VGTARLFEFFVLIRLSLIGVVVVAMAL